MATIDMQCAVCEASFRPGNLDETGKCALCAKEYPGVKNKLEAIALNKPELTLHEDLTEERVREIVREEMAKPIEREEMDKPEADLDEQYEKVLKKAKNTKYTK